MGPSVFSPHRLFASAPSESADILSYSEFLDRARKERARGDTDASRAALAGYLVARLVARWTDAAGPGTGAGAGPGAADEQESFEWQRASTRRYVDELDGSRAETRFLQSVLDGLEAEPAARARALGLALTAFAYFLEHEGRLGEALHVVRLAALTYPGPVPPSEFATLALLTGRLNRMQARWAAANQAYAAAADAAAIAGDRATLLRSLLGQVNVLRGQGNLPRARALAEAVIAEAEGDELTDVRSGAFADLSFVLELQGLPLEALRAAYEAARLARDPLVRLRMLGDLGVKLAAQGYADEAKLALEIVAGSEAAFVVRTNAALELMALESARGNRLAFERHRNAVRDSVSQMPPSMAVDFHYKVGLGLARFGVPDRARGALAEALRLSEAFGLNEWYFRIERVLRHLDECTTEELSAAPSGPAERPAWLAAVPAGLREVAETVSS